MSVDRDIVVPDHWSVFYQATGIPAGVKIEAELTLTGHTGDGPDGFSADPVEQVRQTMRNIEATLEFAGATWYDVIEIRSYHVGLRLQSRWLADVVAEFIRPPLPAWTAVGITELFEPEAVVEISCRALLHESTD